MRHRTAALILVVLLGPASCSGGTPHVETTTTAAMVQGGGELTFGVELDVTTLAPGEAAHSSETLIALAIYDPLMTYVDGRIAPFLAESVASNEDLTKYTITLRQGVVFHDGTPLDAEAVVKHFERLQAPETSCPCAFNLSQLTSMDTPKGATGRIVVFNLSAPSVRFPDLLAGSTGYIESPTAVAGGLDLRTGGVGTGPFSLAEVAPGGRVVLEANPSYWGHDGRGVRLPYLDKLTVLPIAGSAARLDALRRGDIDILQTSDATTMREAEDAGFTTQRLTGSGSVVLLLNNAESPFDDVRARRAVAHAIDKDAINARRYDGMRVPSYSLFGIDSAFHNPRAGAPKFDPAEARELVDDLGGLRFTITCSPNAEIDPILQIIEELGEAAGMEIAIEHVGEDAFVGRVSAGAGEFEAACYRNPAFIEPDAVRAGLTTGSTANLVFYSNREVDHLLDEASRTTDFEDRKERYFRVQERIAEDVPLITILYDQLSNVYDEGRVGPPPDGESNSLGAIKPALLYATDH